MIGLLILISGIILYIIGVRKLLDVSNSVIVQGTVVGWTTAPGLAPVNYTQPRRGPNDFPVLKFTHPDTGKQVELPSNHSMAGYRVRDKLMWRNPKLGEMFTVRYLPKSNQIHRPGGEKNIKLFGQGFIVIGILLIIFEVLLRLLL